MAAVAAISRVAISHDGRDDSSRGDLANGVVGLLGDVEIARGIDLHARGAAQLGASGLCPIAGVPTGAVSRDGRDDPRGGHFADNVVIVVCDIEVARGVHRDTDWTVELRGGCQSTVSGITPGPVASDCRNVTGGSDLPYYRVAPIRNIEVSGGIQRKADRLIELGEGGKPSVARVTRGTVARDRADNAGRCDLANHVIVTLGDVEIPGRVNNHAGRGV